MSSLNFDIYTGKPFFNDTEDEEPTEIDDELTTPGEEFSDSERYEDARPPPRYVSDCGVGDDPVTPVPVSIANSWTNEAPNDFDTDCETSSWTGVSTTGSKSVLDAEVGLSLLEQLRKLQVSLDARSVPTLSTGEILRQGGTGSLVLRANSAYRVWSIFIEKKFSSEGLGEIYSYAMSDSPDKYFSERKESRALQILVENMSINFHKILYGRSSVVHCLRSLRERCKPEVIENEAYVALLRTRFGDNNNPLKYFQRVRSLLASVYATRDIKRDEAILVAILRANFEKPYRRSAKDCSTLTQLETKITNHWVQRKISHAQLE